MAEYVAGDMVFPSQSGQHCSKVSPTLHTFDEAEYYQAPLWILRVAQTTGIGTMLMPARVDVLPVLDWKLVWSFSHLQLFSKVIVRKPRSTAVAVGVRPEDG
jgi:hypothetical protein